MRRGLVMGVVGLVVVAVVAIAVYTSVRAQRERQARLAAITAAEEFVTAWGEGDWSALDALTDVSGAGAAHADAAQRLDVGSADLALTDVDVDEVADGVATAAYRATFTLAGLGEWTYDGRLALTGTETDWAVAWTPSTLHPALADGQRLTRTRHWPERAAVLDRHGADLSAGPFANLLGSVAEATEDQLRELGPPYVAGDVVGRSGLQRSLERRLAGEPGGEVRVVDADSGEVIEVLHEFTAVGPEPVHTALDPGVQSAGQAALGPVSNPAALVAIDAGTFEVRAVVNTPGGGFDRALSGRYPPGSTFKVVTTAALLAHGLDPAQTVDCPGTVSVTGRSFRNAGYAALGAISFREAFAESCNTAFVDQASQLPDGALEAAAARFGFNVDYDIGVPVAGSRFPEPTDEVDHAAASIGQGRVEATPLHMASVAAAIAAGRWQPPRLIVEEDDATAGVDGDAPEPLGEPLPAQLADLMRHAVAAGTGTAAEVAGEPVAGKTGTAEYTASGTPTHAWFIAFRGDLAIAILVESGGFGGEVAAPAAARFYSAAG